MEKSLKLHLGCGEKYLEGYVNIDFPQSEQTVIRTKADVFSDMRTLSYPENSVDEIRSHHLFEHFSRAHALALLSRWRTWLKPGGLLVIETPDFTTSAALFLVSSSLRRRFELARHIFGSQEAGWADHKDFWDKEKFIFTLNKFGFVNVKARGYSNGLAQHAARIPKIGSALDRIPKGIVVPILNAAGNLLPANFYKKYGTSKLPNILVHAVKSSADVDPDGAAREILSLSLAGREGDSMLNVWMKDFRNF